MTLHIIGNGFDLAHGIASTYKDFKNYAWKHGDQYQIGLLETCYPEMNPQHKELELWCDLERALGNPDFQAAFDEATEDIELEDGHEGRYQAQMEDAPEYALEMMFAAFHKAFDDWVNHIDTDVEPLSNIENFDENGRFLSFNYTDTLERCIIYHENASTIFMGDEILTTKSLLGIALSSMQTANFQTILRYTNIKDMRTLPKK